MASVFKLEKWVVMAGVHKFAGSIGMFFVLLIWTGNINGQEETTSSNEDAGSLAIEFAVNQQGAATSLQIAAPQATIATKETIPTKAKLVETLKSLWLELEKQDWEAAAMYVVIPPRLKSEDLAGLVKANEISMSGIRRLERDANFGTAAEMFGSQRAEHFASKMGVSAEDCYGMNHEVDDVTAEVIAKNGMAWNSN